jgi:undecaprenyl diphosphate synthase
MQHLACIMDGNRRFAKKLGWKPWLGHKKGVESVKIAIDFCLKNSIPHLSLYTLSIENLKRSREETDFLFSLLAEQIVEYTDELVEKGIRVCFVGDRTMFPKQTAQACLAAEQATVHGDKLRINFLFCYGGQQEVVAAAQKVAQSVQSGKMVPTDITIQTFGQTLWLSDVPAPDLVFRTGGVKRLSNFLLFQAAYAEFYFSDILWPEVTHDDLQQALETFNRQTRNFGS